MTGSPIQPGPPALSFEVVQDDRPCSGCGYNLCGISLFGVCPECGTKVGAAPRSITKFTGPRDGQGGLGDASVVYLLLLSTSLLLLALSGGAMFILNWISWDIGWSWARLYALGGATALWLFSVAVVLWPVMVRRGAEKPPSDSAPWFGVRLFTALTQGAWLSYMPLLVAEARAAAAGAAITASSSLIFALGVFGLTGVSLVLSNLCDRAGDESLKRRLEALAWPLGLLSFLLLLYSATREFHFVRLTSALAIMMFIAWFVAFAWMLLSALQMVPLVVWAYCNARERAARDERVRLMRQRQAASPIPEAMLTGQGISLGAGGLIGARVEPSRSHNDNPSEPEAPAQTGPAVPVVYSHEMVIERPPDVQPYGLEETNQPTGPAPG